jgi:alkylation response protein AidB-like acyl-CoA dehydrogenase
MLSAEQDEIDRTVKRLFANRTAARRAAEGGSAICGALWSNLAELGLIGIALPEQDGGTGLGLAEECVVAEALGVFVAPAPVLPAYCAAHVLTHGDERAIATALASAETVVGVGLSAGRGLPDLTLTGDGASARLSGTIPDLVEGMVIELLLLPAAGRWWAIDLSGPGVERQPVVSLDATRPLARLALDGAPARAVSRAEPAAILAIAQTLIAAEALGVAQAALDMAKDYALTREQFGQPIGRFQAIKQKLADCLIRVEGARSAVWGAVRSVREDAPDTTAARLAKAEATAAAVFVVAEATQIHGAIGVTWEHDLHLLMRRAKYCQLVLGSPDQHLRTLGDAMIASAHDRQETATDVGFVPSAEDEAFIAPFRAWLDEHATPDRVKEIKRSGLAARRAWQAELAEAGWIALHWAKAAGGREASFTQQVLYYAEMAKRGLPPLPGNRGLMLVGPTLIAHGSDFHRRLLEPTRRADILWAGGFSERGAGSDLASLRTRGVIEGDSLVINGHKIWTSQAQQADWMYALIRTGPLQPKHDGISVVLIPMDADGVQVRPIRRNSGDHHFNEVFFDDVRVPLSHVVGPLGEGWRINRTTMVGEHLTNFLGSQSAQAGLVRRIARVIADREAVDGIDPALRMRLAHAWATVQIVGLHGLRNVARFSEGDNPGAEGSISKLVGQESEKTLYELMIDAQGAAGLEESMWTRAWLSTRASTIGGGTSEIHRNKLAERVLGMPRDPWADEEAAPTAGNTAASWIKPSMPSAL